VQSIRVGPLQSAFRSRSQTTSKLLRSKAVGSVCVGGEKRRKLAQVCIRETNESEPFRGRVVMNSECRQNQGRVAFLVPEMCPCRQGTVMRPSKSVSRNELAIHITWWLTAPSQKGEFLCPTRHLGSAYSVTTGSRSGL
jgi:hypothetical protein